MDDKVAEMFAAISAQLGSLQATVSRIEAQTKATNGHVADAFKRISRLERAASVQRHLSARRRWTLMTIATLFGGSLCLALNPSVLQRLF